VLMGPLPGPLPLFPPDHWWNTDISKAPVDSASDAYIAWIGLNRGMHPDLGGDVSPGSADNYGFSYAVVDASQPLLAVQFNYADESDGVDHATNQSFPFYPVPAEAITQPHWLEGGQPGNIDLRGQQDRHLLIVDKDQNYLYELYNCWWSGAQWRCGSGAFYDMNTNNRRPDGWTSADAAGLAILPGLVRHDEVYGAGEIGHAFRVTLRTSCGYVYPASHETTCSDASSLPMGARLRLKSTTDLSSFTSDMLKILRAMQTYGLIMADNGSDMYVSGTYDNNWDNGSLNPQFARVHASDFEVVTLGWKPTRDLLRDASITTFNPPPDLAAILPLGPGTPPAGNDYMASINDGDTDKQSDVVVDAAHPLVFFALSSSETLHLVKASGTGFNTVRVRL